MTTYQKRIQAIIGSDIDPRHVEAYMRLGCEGTLDGLTPSGFAREARECADAVKADPVQAEALAKSYGL